MIELTSHQKLKQKKLLFDMKSEIDRLNFQINHQKLEMIKANLIKNVKINICRGRLVAPYVITASICFGIGSLFGTTPFIFDKEKCYQKVMEEKDSLGNIRCEKQYESFNESDNVLTYYEAWHKNSNGTFFRKVHVYKIGNVSLEVVKNILDGSFNKSLEDIFGKPIVSKIETKNKVSDEELNNGSHIQARFYSVNDDDYIFVDQSITKNIFESILYIFIVMFLEWFVRSYRMCYPFDYDKRIEKINKKYSIKYIDTLVKQLEIREKNYQRLINYDGIKDLVEQYSDIKVALSATIFKYVNSNACDQFSSIDGVELQKIFVLLDELYLQIRSSLNISDKETFGYELELEKVDINYIYSKIKQNCLRGKWTLKYDGSLNDGIEINSPVLWNKEEDWGSLDRVCVAIQKGAIVGTNSAGHIHLGTQILGDNPNAWKRFIKLYAVYEPIIFRFLYGEYLTNRKSLEKYAEPMANELWNDYIYLKDKDVTVKEIVSQISHGRCRALNFNNVKYDTLNEYSFGNTIEVRIANDTKESAIHQNNYNLFAHMGMYARSSKFDDEIIDKRHETNDSSYYNLNWYNEIFLEQALEFCDLIFDNNLDKVYFLKQYLKSFEISYTEFYKSKKKLTKPIKYS